jgi:hypothetical protein
MEAVMDAQTLLQTATVLLGITAAGGLAMAIMRFAGADSPQKLSPKKVGLNPTLEGRLW